MRMPLSYIRMERHFTSVPMGHNTMGGFDIFQSQLTGDEYLELSEPMNVGYPINTPDDDIYYVVSPDGKTAYFSSFREDGFGEKDIYTAKFIDKKKYPLL